MIVEAIRAEFLRCKMLTEGAIAQVADERLTQALADGENSIAFIVWHIAGNFRSRFTGFLDSDGEKPWRDRDSEFVERHVSRDELLAKWEEGWECFSSAVDHLSDGDLSRTVFIRGVEHTVAEALLRLLAHLAMHAGQIILLAKTFAGAEWKTLSIPKAGSAAYNANPVLDKPPHGKG